MQIGKDIEEEEVINMRKEDESVIVHTDTVYETIQATMSTRVISKVTNVSDDKIGVITINLCDISDHYTVKCIGLGSDEALEMLVYTGNYRSLNLAEVINELTSHILELGNRFGLQLESGTVLYVMLSTMFNTFYRSETDIVLTIVPPSDSYNDDTTYYFKEIVV